MSATTTSEPQVVYVERKRDGNGLAIGALVTGIVALVFGLAMNILFPVAIGGGLVAIVLGLIACRRPARRKMAICAAILGVLASAAGVYGGVQVAHAAHELQQAGQQLQSLSQQR